MAVRNLTGLGNRARPPALPLPTTSPGDLAAQWAHYRMGPLTPAPLMSPGIPDTFNLDPLHALRPPAGEPRAVLMERSPSLRRRDNERLLCELASALEEERAQGTDPQILTGMCQLTGVSPQSLQRFESLRRLMREEQVLAQEGDTTSWRPGGYFLLALVGRILIGMGATLLEHLVLPGQPNQPGTVAPDGAGPHLYDFDQRPSQVKVMGGAVMLGVGVLCALGAAYLFWRQATQRNPRRAALLTSLHLCSLALAVIHSFLFEWVLYNRPPKELLYASIPSVFSTGLYAYTVPNSLTAAEVQLGLLPIGSTERRTELALVLGAIGAALFVLLGGLAAQKDIQSYEKQGVLIGATVFLTTGTALAFTNARRYQSRLERGKALRERARQASLTHAPEPDQTAGPRRPTALPEQLGRELLSVRSALPSRSHPFSESTAHMLGTPRSVDGAATPAEEPPVTTPGSPAPGAGAPLQNDPGDYFTLPFHSAHGTVAKAR